MRLVAISFTWELTFLPQALRHEPLVTRNKQMTDPTPVRRLLRLFDRMMLFGILLLVIALVWGVVVGSLAHGAIVAIAVAGGVATLVGIWEGRRLRKSVAKLRSERGVE